MNWITKSVLIFCCIGFFLVGLVIPFSLAYNDQNDQSEILSAPESSLSVESATDEADIYIELIDSNQPNQPNQCFVGEDITCHV